MPPDADLARAVSLAFAGTVQCRRVAPDGWRLTGQLRGAAVIVDLFAGGVAAQALEQLAAQELRDVVLSRAAGPAGDWTLTVAGRGVPLPQLRVFVHQDVVEQAAAAIPPRRVRWSKRLFWSTLLALLRTTPGRNWVRRRYGV